MGNALSTVFDHPKMVQSTNSSDDVKRKVFDDLQRQKTKGISLNYI